MYTAPNALNASQAHYSLCNLISDAASEQVGRHYKKGTSSTRELLHVGITIDNPIDRVVFTRPINPAFAIAEVLWILAGSNDVKYISWWNPIMKQFSDNGKTLWGAYGARLGAEVITNESIPAHPTGSPIYDSNQLRYAYKSLAANPESRQVVLNIYNAEYDAPRNGSPRSKDIPCNITSILNVRDGKLHWMQTMRSNDLIWGTPYNFIQWTMLQEIMAGWLGLEIGQYTHMVSSLHVYEQHFADLANILIRSYWDYQLPHNTADLRLPYEESVMVWNELADLSVRMMAVEKLENSILKLDELEAIEAELGNLPQAYYQLGFALMAEVCRKEKLWEQALRYASEFTSGKYWGASFRMWLRSKNPELEVGA